MRIDIERIDHINCLQVSAALKSKNKNNFN